MENGGSCGVTAREALYIRGRHLKVFGEDGVDCVDVGDGTLQAFPRVYVLVLVDSNEERVKCGGVSEIVTSIRRSAIGPLCFFDQVFAQLGDSGGSGWPTSFDS